MALVLGLLRGVVCRRIIALFKKKKKKRLKQTKNLKTMIESRQSMHKHFHLHLAFNATCDNNAGRVFWCI